MNIAPRRARLAACAAAAALALGTGTAHAQVAPLPEISPGPFPVAFWDWDFGNTTTTHPSTGQPLSVQNFGRLYYPTDGSGGALPPVAAGSFPLVVYGHGRFHTAPFIGANHLGANYLMAHLASWGIVATSVNLDVVGQFGAPAAIPQRGDILLTTVQRTLDLANQPGAPPAGLAAAIDATLIGLAGHSRGGEGVVDALVKNAASGSFPIVAATTIAPTDFEQYTAPADVPYLGLYGSKDGDVNNGWPIYVHDRSQAEEKVFEWIYGANHFWFTESITCSCEGNADISRQLHHDIAKGYMGGFLIRKLSNTPLGSAVFSDGPEMAPLTSQVPIHPMYKDPVRMVLDDFEAFPSLSVSSEGLSVAASLTSNSEGSFDNTSLTLYHKTDGFVGGWSGGASGRWIVRLGVPGGFDSAAFTHLSAKFAARQTATLNPVGMDQDVSLLLADTDLDVATVPLSNFGNIPYPITHPGAGPFGPNFPTKSVLRTTRVPLSAFAAANPALDLDSLLAAGWISNQTFQGEAMFDDLEFTQ